MRQTTLQLTDSDRQTITAFRCKGIHPTRSVNRAHILSALDHGIREKEIMRVLGMGRTAPPRAVYPSTQMTSATDSSSPPGSGASQSSVALYYTPHTTKRPLRLGINGSNMARRRRVCRVGFSAEERVR